MEWRLEYYDGQLPLVEVSGVPWADLDVHSVQRVFVVNGDYTMIMQGHDFYWINEENDAFGCFIGPHNYDIYEGKMSSSFAVVDGNFVDTGEELPGVGINVLGSAYMPEDEAKEVGIL